MILARAIDVSGAFVPFGAAHRVYFDTPPLKGCCMATLVAIQRLVENESLADGR
jgi:hypothetical protein